MWRGLGGHQSTGAGSDPDAVEGSGIGGRWEKGGVHPVPPGGRGGSPMRLLRVRRPEEEGEEEGQQGRVGSEPRLQRVIAVDC